MATWGTEDNGGGEERRELILALKQAFSASNFQIIICLITYSEYWTVVSSIHRKTKAYVNQEAVKKLTLFNFV